MLKILSTHLNTNEKAENLSASSLFAFYRTLTGITSEEYRPVMNKLQGVSYLLISNASSFYLYDLERLSLMFYTSIEDVSTGLNFSGTPRFTKFLLDGHVVIGALQRTLFWTTRGRLIHSVDFEGDVVDFFKIGSVIVSLLDCNGVSKLVFSDVVYDETSSSQVSFTTSYTTNTLIFGNKQISGIFHPLGYRNKLLVYTHTSTGNTSFSIYNFETRKLIFNFTINGIVTDVQQTSVTDILGFGITDGRVIVYDIKKSKQVFVMSVKSGEKGPRISFSNKMMAVTANSCLSIYDMELRKVVANLSKDISYGEFIGPGILLVTTSKSIQIYEVGDGLDEKLRCIKERMILPCGVRGMKRLSEKEFVVWTGKEVYRVGLYRDEQTTCINKSKSDDNILDVSVDGYIGIRKEGSVFVYGDPLIKYGWDGKSSNSSIRLIMESHAATKWIKIHKEFMLTAQKSKIVLLNVNSMRIVFEKQFEEVVLAGDFDSGRIVLLFAESLHWIDIETSTSQDIPFEGAATGEHASLSLCNELLFIHTHHTVYVYCKGSFRTFSAEAYSLDSLCQYITTIYKGDLYVYDIVTGRLIEQCTSNVSFRDILVLDKFKFVAVSDTNGSLHLLSNQSYFNVLEKKSIIERNMKNVSEIKSKMKSTTFYSEMLMSGAGSGCNNEEEYDLTIKGMSKEELKELIANLYGTIQRGNGDVYKVLHILKKILLFRHSVLKSSDVEKIKDLTEGMWKGFQDGYISTLGVLQNNNIQGI